MRFFDGFANIHPFFVHAPVVLIPTARRHALARTANSDTRL
jgi:hypothetical protein